jgi:REP element-mobilizing transposase RayT
MANTFTQLYIHLVFAVQGRQSLIQPRFKDELYKYITGIVQHPDRNHKLIAINGMPDYIHIFVGLRPTIAISDLVRDIKASSSGLINERRWTHGRFEWQEGYGAFSNSHSQIGDVVRYIEQQTEHHAQITFREEYVKMLERYDVPYDPKYLFKWIEDVAVEE